MSGQASGGKSPNLGQRRPKGRPARRRGRPRNTGSKITPEMGEEIRVAYNRGSQGVAEICKKYGVKESSVRGYLARRGITQQRQAYRETLTLTAQQYAEKEAQKHAELAAQLVRDTIEDMSLIIRGLRYKLNEEMAFLDIKSLKEAGEAYRIAVGEQRRALGLAEAVEGQQQKTLVSIQCVGEVTVRSDDQPGMRPLPQLPDLSSIIPSK